MKPLPEYSGMTIFNPDCRQCKRLDDFLLQVKQKHPEYHARPVAPFGVAEPKLLVVGLAPGMHGANATGRPFTGDYAGLLLYETLFEFGYSNKPQAESLHDGLELAQARITNAVKCLPPQNKPTPEEIKQCNPYLAAEIRGLPERAIILALGSIAHQAVLKVYKLPIKQAPFKHNQVTSLPDQRFLVSSYHSSRYNVQTKRLTKAMFVEVFQTIASLNQVQA